MSLTMDNQPDYVSELENHRSYLLRIARKMLRNPTAAEDLVQDTFINAITNMNKFDGRNLGGWLYVIMKRLMITQARKHLKRREIFAEVEPEIAEQISQVLPQQDLPFLQRDLDKALTLLNKRQRQCFEVINEDNSYDRAAEKLGIPSGTVKSNVHRARQIIREFVT